jgi:hypothetical protein
MAAHLAQTRTDPRDYGTPSALAGSTPNK